MLKMAVSIDTTTPPTRRPMTTIIIGSSSRVNCMTDARNYLS